MPAEPRSGALICNVDKIATNGLVPVETVRYGRRAGDRLVSGLLILAGAIRKAH